MHLLFLPKYLEYKLIWGSFIHKGAGKTLPLYTNPIKYSNESLLPCDFLSGNTILWTSTS